MPTVPPLSVLAPVSGTLAPRWDSGGGKRPSAVSMWLHVVRRRTCPIGVIAGPTFEEQTHISSVVKTEAAPQSRLCLALNDYTYRSRVVSDIVLLMVNMV